MRSRHHWKRYRFASLFALLFAACFAAVPSASAQGFAVEGVVLDAEDGTPLPGVNVVEVGTTNGTITDADGAFDLTVEDGNASLQFTFVGYQNQTVALNGRQELTVQLEESVEALDEVVVTAFGIEQQEKALGYSISQVDGEELAEINETNIANTLAGKVSGVLVQKPASGPAGSSRVIIRGITSLDPGDNNQPLYVVDGIPIDNSNLGQAGMWGGADGGDGISSLDANEIESVSVLKSAAAAALYGSRAKNGVILITTKRAQAGSGLGVTFNSNLTFERVLVDTDFQQEYGQGSRGEKPESQEEALGTNFSSWGAPLDGSSVIQWDGVERPYSFVDGRLNDFYDVGLTADNSIALTTSTENAALRFSLSHLQNRGISPSSGLSRTNFTLRGNSTFGERLSVDAKLNFIRDDVKNRPRLSDSPGNANASVYNLAPNIPVQPMECPVNADECGEPGRDVDETEYRISSGTFTQNPYFAATQFLNRDEERRLIGLVSARYQFTDWLSLQGRFGGDTYTTRRTSIEPWGTAYIPGGSQSETDYRITEINTDFLLMANRDLNDAITLTGDFGGNIRYSQNETLTLSGGGGYNIPNFEVVTNLANPGTGYGYVESQINSLYARAEASYNDYLFVTVTGRNDWSSTLPTDNNSYFYPSVSSSFVFSDAFEMPSWLSFGKLRAAWASVGGDTNPYRLALTYSLAGSGHLGQARGGVSQSEIPLADLKPYRSDEYEAGFNVQFLDSRLGLDFTYYNKTTTNQILATTISSTSGYNSKVINAGEITNSGLEVLLTTTPVYSENWRWDVDFNFSQNNNEVVSLIEGQTSLVLSESRLRGNFVTADVGEPYGTIKGNRYLRDAQGNIVFDDDGLPLADGSLSVLGVGTPDVLGGISTSLRYRDFTLSGLVDMRFGGDIFSALNASAYSNGLHKNTLQGRDGLAFDEDGNVISGGIVGQGVSRSSCTEQEDGTLTNCSANTVTADPQSYFGRIGGNIGEEFVYDASFVKLRQLQLTYRLPSQFLEPLQVQFASVSLVGRNLWLIHSNVPNLDPESSFRTDSQGIGLELAGVPQTRSFGFNLNLRF